MTDNEIPWYISLFVAWLPFLFLMALGYYMVRQLRRDFFTKDGRSIADVFAELTVELKRRNDRPDGVR